MTVRFEFDHPHLGAYGVTLPAYQWDYTYGVEYQQRDLGETPVGVTYKARRNVSRRLMTLRFVQTETVLAALQTFHILVQRFVRDVRFYPNFDTAPGTYWELDWETEVALTIALDNRLEAELRVVEKMPDGAIFV